MKNSHKLEEELKQEHFVENGVIKIEKQNSTVFSANLYSKEVSAYKIENSAPKKAFQAICP